MTWEDHAKVTSIKIIQKTGLLKRISHFRPLSGKILLFDYGDTELA